METEKETRADGFIIQAETGCGWDIFAPGGQFCAWAASREELERKIAREKREKLFHCRTDWLEGTPLHRPNVFRRWADKLLKR